MTSVKSPKIVRPQSKGMVTIPSEFREKLKIDENSLLQVKLVKNGVLFVKIEYKTAHTKNSFTSEPSIYSDKQIKQFLKDDKLDNKTIEKLKKLLT